MLRILTFRQAPPLPPTPPPPKCSKSAYLLLQKQKYKTMLKIGPKGMPRGTRKSSQIIEIMKGVSHGAFWASPGCSVLKNIKKTHDLKMPCNPDKLHVAWEG